MNKISIRFYNDHEVRAVWVEESARWYFSVLDVISQMGAMQLGHVIEEYVYILILSGVYQSLNIFALILF